MTSLDKAIAILEGTRAGDPKRQAKIEEELEAARAAKEALVLHPNVDLPIKGIKQRRQEQLHSREVKSKEDGISPRSRAPRRPHSTSANCSNKRVRRGKRANTNQNSGMSESETGILA